MKTFWEFTQQFNEEPMPPMGPPGGAPPMPGGAPIGGPGGMPPMGGPMGGMGGPPPPMGGGAPMGGAPAPAEPAKQIRPNTVWEILEKLLDGKPVDKLKKSAGQPNPNMLQGAQLPPQPSPEQGSAPPGPPAQQPPMMM